MTIEKLTAILTIENLNDNLCYLTIKSDSGQHSQFLQCFKCVWGLVGTIAIASLVFPQGGFVGAEQQGGGEVGGGGEVQGGGVGVHGAGKLGLFANKISSPMEVAPQDTQNL